MDTGKKTALITGASSGIGKALAENFARDGYAVILTARSENKLEILAENFAAVSALRRSPMADLESPNWPERLYAEVKKRGMVISALVNNAGFGAFGEFKDADLEQLLSMMRLNMNAVVALAKLFLPDLLATKGKLLNTASTASFQPGPFFGGLRRNQGFCLELFRGPWRGTCGDRCNRHGALPRPYGVGIRKAGRYGQIGIVQKQKAAELGRGRRRGLSRHETR